MKIAAFDIETIPAQNLPEGCEPEVKIGNMTDPVKIAAKVAAAIDKTAATDPAMCQVTTFCGMMYDTREHKVIEKVSAQWPPAESEYNGIFEAWKFINVAHSNRDPLVSFNGSGFDLPVLLFRAMALDVPVDPEMYAQLTKKWGTNLHYDLQQILAGYNPSRWHRFEVYLRLFKIGGKTEGMDGSKVYGAWKAKEYDKIQKYCEGDVLNLCKLFERVEHWIKME